jgi:hypothetical protein
MARAIELSNGPIAYVCFKSLKKAKSARKKAEHKYYGVFACN